MKIVKVFALGVIFPAIVLLFSSDSINAKGGAIGARCYMPLFPYAKQQAKAIFVGKVIKKESNGDEKIFEFEVQKYWKGSGTKKTKISVYETMRFQAWFEVGETYLIFADRDKDGKKLYVGKCSLSQKTDNASEELKLLGKAKKPKN